MRIVYMGTPDFAVPALEALYEAGHEISAVVSQPDKPRGRHGEPAAPPVKEKAKSLGIPVLQPEKASDADFIEQIRELAPDVIVVAAYGKILKQTLLDIPKYGCINIHASLLPRWRGAAPIQWAVIEGDQTAGVTTMQMNAGLDTGDMLLRREITLSPEETGGSLFEKLSALSGELILETLKKAEDGTLHPEPQPEAGVTYASMLTKEMGDIDWSLPARRIECLVRGLYPWPGTYSHLGGKLLKIHRAEILSDEEEAKLPERFREAEPGTLYTDGNMLCVRCKDGVLSLPELQLEGKKRMDSAAFLRGAGELVRREGCLTHK
ncbi:MAG: methionyl-tRNA formyltransferase [Eubacteriales bacterium]|nr:methionyl-tRNA formyltransferase [Eubacteriales bacterium]